MKFLTAFLTTYQWILNFKNNNNLTPYLLYVWKKKKKEKSQYLENLDAHVTVKIGRFI